MGMYEKTFGLSRLLEQFAEDLDIPESKYLEAERRYKAVGEWLGSSDSFLTVYKPEIYTQGSFCLGTVIKPISDKDEYDIDLVCYLPGLRKQNTSQKHLKQMVGDRLKENDRYKQLLDLEGRRCWTLTYANEFHMDILPAIADETLRARGGVDADAILITDKKQMEQDSLEWPRSNPKGYAKWFQSCQEKMFATLRKGLAEAAGANVDDVPNYRVKTPLQRTIQILKRHRDIFCLKNKIDEGKPVSIIITTLSANLYNGQDNTYAAIYDILLGINESVVKQGSKFFIPNPVNPKENFADKWNENQSLAQIFFRWINDARNTFTLLAIEKADDIKTSQKLEESLGVKSRDIKNERVFLSASPSYATVNTSKKRQPWKCA